ncbi:MAG: metal-binding protein [Oscillochloris sp.]|nr:metal-binding protein [Oscillochloris sp.]
MPGARTHDVITVLSGAAIAPLVQSFQTYNGIAPEIAWRNTAILVGAHLLSGIMFSPDLDLDSAIDNRWGPFYWIWRPYMHLVPHRHFWSHSLVISPLLRLGYFYLMLVLILVGGGWLLAQVGVIVPAYHRQLTDWILGLVRSYPQQTRAFLAGFITGSAAHTIADYLVTDGKRFLAYFGIRLRRSYRNHDRYR